MDQEPENEAAASPIINDTPTEQGHIPGARDEAITTPESEDTDAKLPVLQRYKKTNGKGEKMTLEIPDSEEVSELSSPVKVSRQEGERLDAILQGIGGLQPVEEGQEVEIEEDITANGERKAKKLEIPDSEVASELSSPVKVDMGSEPTHDGAVRTVVGSETIGKIQGKEDELEDTTIVDVSTPVQGNGIVRVEGSRAAEGVELDRWKASENGKPDPADFIKGIECTLNMGGGLPPIFKDDRHVQGALSKEMEDAPLANTTLNTGNGKIDEEETSSTAPSHEVSVIKGAPDKGEDVVVTELAQTDFHTEGSVNSSAVNTEEMAIAAQKLLAETPPTISGVSDMARKLKVLKTIALSAIPDSDDDEDEDLPDAPASHEDAQQPAPTASGSGVQPSATMSPMVSSDRVSKMTKIQPSMSKLDNIGKEYEREVAASSFEEKSPAHVLFSDDTSASPETVSDRHLKRDTTSPRTSINQPTQGGEHQPSLEPLSSLTKLEASSPILERKVVQPNITQEFSQRNKEASQAVDITSSPPQPASEDSFQAKRNRTPSASFHAPEASQNKDVLMAELKAMKIASIQARINALEAEIASKRAKLEEVTKDLTQPAAETVKRHIKLLHDYNDIKDVGQGLVGMIADNRGVRIGELYREFGVDLRD